MTRAIITNTSVLRKRLVEGNASVSDIVVGRQLTQRYGRRYVFRSLDLTIPAGVTALLGPNGAGKTTLLSMITGLRRPASGSLTVLGRDVGKGSDRRALAIQLGFLPQSVGYYPGYRLREFVSYAAWLKRVPQDELRSRVTDALAAVDLIDRENCRMRSLSGGLLRRAGIAQAIVHRPELLVLDEPSAGLDPQQRIELRRLIQRLAKHSTVLLSTHLVDDIRTVADRVLLLDEGAVVFSGSPAALETEASPDIDGDTPLERGYATILARGRA